jgi:hypothetical protein
MALALFLDYVLTATQVSTTAIDSRLGNGSRVDSPNSRVPQVS